MASLGRGRVLVFLPAFVEACRTLHHCRRGARDAICQQSEPPTSPHPPGRFTQTDYYFYSVIEENARSIIPIARLH